MACGHFNYFNPDGIAVDWINKMLYWTDAHLKKIEVFDLIQGHRKHLFFTGENTTPRAIIVDPTTRSAWLVWAVSLMLLASTSILEIINCGFKRSRRYVWLVWWLTDLDHVWYRYMFSRMFIPSTVDVRSAWHNSSTVLPSMVYTATVWEASMVDAHLATLDYYSQQEVC